MISTIDVIRIALYIIFKFYKKKMYSPNSKRHRYSYDNISNILYIANNIPIQQK